MRKEIQRTSRGVTKSATMWLLKHGYTFRNSASYVRLNDVLLRYMHSRGSNILLHKLFCFGGPILLTEITEDVDERERDESHKEIV